MASRDLSPGFLDAVAASSQSRLAKNKSKSTRSMRAISNCGGSQCVVPGGSTVPGGGRWPTVVLRKRCATRSYAGSLSASAWRRVWQ